MQSLKKWEAIWISSIRKSLFIYSVMFIVTKCQQRRTNLKVRGDIVILIAPFDTSFEVYEDILPAGTVLCRKNILSFQLTSWMLCLLFSTQRTCHPVILHWKCFITGHMWQSGDAWPWETHVDPFVLNAGLLIGRLLEAVLLLNNSMRAIKSHLLTIGNINHVCTLVIYSTLLMDQCWTIHGLTLCLHYDPFNINLMIHIYAL